MCHEGANETLDTEAHYLIARELQEKIILSTIIKKKKTGNNPNVTNSSL